MEPKLCWNTENKCKKRFEERKNVEGHEKRSTPWQPGWGRGQHSGHTPPSRARSWCGGGARCCYQRLPCPLQNYGLHFRPAQETDPCWGSGRRRRPPTWPPQCRGWPLLAGGGRRGESFPWAAVWGKGGGAGAAGWAGSSVGRWPPAASPRCWRTAVGGWSGHRPVRRPHSDLESTWMFFILYSVPRSVVNPKTLYLDPDPEICPILDPSPSLFPQ